MKTETCKPRRSKFCKFLDIENFSLDLAFNIRGQRENTPYSSSELNESGIVNRQSGGDREIETWVQWTTNRKWPVGIRIVT